MTRKWRPSLAMVLGAALAGTLFLALIGLVLLRYLGPELGFRNAAGLIIAVIAVLTAVLGLMLVRLLLRPMRALARYAGAVRHGRSEAKPPDQFGTRELRETAATVIEMADTLKTRETTIRSYSDHVTHELKSPVTAILAAAELLQDRDLGDQEARLVVQIAGAADQMNAELDALRRVVRAREADYRGTSTLDDIMPALAAKNPAMRVATNGGETPLPLSAEGLGIVLDHLTGNAAAHRAQTMTLQAHAQTIDVVDDGKGIAPGDLDRVFEPFFTTRRDTGGTGMGLAIVRNILAAHGGTIEAIATETGAHFRIRFL